MAASGVLSGGLDGEPVCREEKKSKGSKPRQPAVWEGSKTAVCHRELSHTPGPRCGRLNLWSSRHERTHTHARAHRRTYTQKAVITVVFHIIASDLWIY